MISYQTEGVKMPDIKKKETTGWIKEVAACYGKRVGEIAYIFCSDDKILEVNRQYLQHDYYTDIITFDYVKGKTISADIFVSLPRILDNTQLHSKDFTNEFHRVLAHGILHLCGYKDKTTEEISLMREKENFYLNIL